MVYVALPQTFHLLPLPELKSGLTESAGSFRSMFPLNIDLRSISREGLMLYWALMFLVVALIAAIFGFTGIAVAAAGIAKLLFFIFLVLFVITFATHLTGRGGRRV